MENTRPQKSDGAVTQLRPGKDNRLGIEESCPVQCQKTQKCTYSRKTNLACPNIVMSGQVLPSNPAISLLGVTASSNLSWHDHVTDLAKASSKSWVFCPERGDLSLLNSSWFSTESRSDRHSSTDHKFGD